MIIKFLIIGLLVFVVVLAGALILVTVAKIGDQDTAKVHGLPLDFFSGSTGFIEEDLPDNEV